MVIVSRVTYVPASYFPERSAYIYQIMYGVLYAVSPEIFPAKDRGTGNGLTATATRVFGVIVRLLLLRAFSHTLTGT